MFKSFDYVRYAKKNWGHIYKLVDTEFECEIETYVPINMPLLASVYVTSNIAKEYEKRNLNVAANLAVYYNNFVISQRSYLTLDYIIKINYEYYPDLSKEFFPKYLENIKRYSILT